MRFTPYATRLAFGILTPVALVSVAAALVGGVAVSMGGCTTEETAQVGSPVTAPGTAPAALATPSRASTPSTFTTTAGLIPGLGGSVNGKQGNTRGSASPLDQLLGASNVANAPAGFPIPGNGLCPPDMASIDDRFCVDRYEASLLQVLPDGTEQAFSPYESLKGQTVRAISEAGVFPQGYISEVQAIQACSLSGKRLCKAKEWRQACMGPEKKTYGYADKSQPGKCNDHGRSPMAALYVNQSLASRDKWDWERMNRPELNQFEGTLAHTGEHDGCTNGYGVYDMVGNLHEWVDDADGTFQGGYYQDTTLNGEGCQYTTTAHEARYHDYSTGFRCCADVAP